MAIISKEHLQSDFLIRVVGPVNPVCLSTKFDKPELVVNEDILLSTSLLDCFVCDQLKINTQFFPLLRKRMQQVNPLALVSLESGLTFFSCLMRDSIIQAGISPKFIRFSDLAEIAYGPNFNAVPANIIPLKLREEIQSNPTYLGQYDMAGLKKPLLTKKILNPSEAALVESGLPAWHGSKAIPNKPGTWCGREIAPYILGHYVDYCLQIAARYYSHVLVPRQSIRMTSQVWGHRKKLFESLFQNMGRMELISVSSAQKSVAPAKPACKLPTLLV